MTKLTRCMRHIALLFLLGLSLAAPVLAADISDGRAIVTPLKDDRFEIDGYAFGKVELFGYMSELKETKGITGIVLKNGKSKNKQATEEQRNAVASIGNTLQLETFVKEDGELVALEHK